MRVVRKSGRRQLSHDVGGPWCVKEFHARAAPDAVTSIPAWSCVAYPARWYAAGGSGRMRCASYATSSRHIAWRMPAKRRASATTAMRLPRRWAICTVHVRRARVCARLLKTLCITRSFHVARASGPESHSDLSTMRISGRLGPRPNLRARFAPVEGIWKKRRPRAGWLYEPVRLFA